MNTNKQQIIPLIIIKKIITILIDYKYEYIYELYYLCKSIQLYINNRVDFIKFRDIEEIEQFKENKLELTKQIKKIEINEDIIYNFKNGLFNSLCELKVVKIKLIQKKYIQSDQLNNQIHFINNIILDKKFEIKYSSNKTNLFLEHFQIKRYWSNYQRSQNIKNFNNLIVLKKFKIIAIPYEYSLKLSVIKSILLNAINLKSIQFSILTNFNASYNWDDPNTDENKRIEDKNKQYLKEFKVFCK